MYSCPSVQEPGAEVHGCQLSSVPLIRVHLLLSCLLGLWPWPWLRAAVTPRLDSSLPPFPRALGLGAEVAWGPKVAQPSPEPMELLCFEALLEEGKEL